MIKKYMADDSETAAYAGCFMEIRDKYSDDEMGLRWRLRELQIVPTPYFNNNVKLYTDYLEDRGYFGLHSIDEVEDCIDAGFTNDLTDDD
jgi:hypothetical protein